MCSNNLNYLQNKTSKYISLFEPRQSILTDEARQSILTDEARRAKYISRILNF